MQVGIGGGLLLLYTVGLVALVSGGGGDDEQRSARAEPLDAHERRVAQIVGAAGVRQLDITDVADFRRARVRTVECVGSSCEVVYAVGVPGGGRLRVQQIDMLEKLYRVEGIQRVKLQAIRDMRVGTQRPLKPEEETAGGATLLTTTCDAARRDDVDWSTRSGGAIIRSICDVKGARPGAAAGGGPPPGRGPDE